MDLNPFEGLAKLVLGFAQQGKIQGWLKIIASLFMSALVTGLGSWGISVLSGAGFLNSVAIAAVAVSGILITAWIGHPETRKIPLFWPGAIERERLKMLEQQNVVSHGVDKK